MSKMGLTDGTPQGEIYPSILATAFCVLHVSSAQCSMGFNRDAVSKQWLHLRLAKAHISKALGGVGLEQ